MLKKILLALIFAITAITNVAHAEDDMKTVASKAYVDTKIETKQLKIPAAGQPNVGAGETVMTYTATGNGQIGERGLYSDISNYDASTDGDKLITASALNATFTNLPTTPTTKLECANESDGCTLWTIVDQTAYARGLPDGYTRLEYIESRVPAADAYIDTGLNFNSDYIYEITYAKGGTNNAIMGARKNTDYTAQGNFSLTYRSNSTALYSSTTSGSSAVVFGDSIFGIQHTVKYQQSTSTLLFDGTNKWFSNWITNVEIPYNVYLFAFNMVGNAGGGRTEYVRIYSYSVKNINGTLIQNFVPAKNSANVLGMYDTVSGTFFTNAGGNDNFVAGPVAN